MAIQISKVIKNWVPSKSKVIDFGCGDGSLLKDLIDTKGICGYAVTHIRHASFAGSGPVQHLVLIMSSSSLHRRTAHQQARGI